MTSTTKNLNGDTEVDLLKMIYNLWNDKLYIFGFTLIFFFLSIIYVQKTSFTYDTYLKVTPTEEFSSSSSASQLGGLASFIGISTSKTKTVNSFVKYKYLLRSRQVAAVLAKDMEFLSIHFPDLSDEIKNNGFEVVEDTSFKKSIKEFLMLPSHNKKIELVDVITSKIETVKLSTNKISGVTTLYFATEHPKKGVELLLRLHKISDSFLKENSINRTNQYIQFLNKQLSLTTKQDQRLALISTLAEQQRNKMIASSDMAFAAELYGSPYQSSAPTKPRLRNIVLFFLILGFLLGTIISMFRYFFIITKR